MTYSPNLRGLVAALSILTASAAAAEDKVNMLIFPFLSQAPIFIALDEGYFAQENIEVVSVPFSSFAAVVPGIMNNDLDVAMMSTSPGFFNALAKGARGRIGAPAITLSRGDCEYLSFYGRDGVGWEALKKGETMTVSVSTEPASVNEFLTDRIHSVPGVQGFSYEIRVSPPQAELEALKSGAVDMIATTEPWITRADKAGIGQTVFGGSELFENMQYSHFLISPRLASDDPDLGRRVIRAIAAGVAQYNQGKTPRNLEIVSKYTKLPVDFLQTACWANIPVGATVDSASIDALQDWYLEKGFISQKMPISDLVQTFQP